MDTSISLLSSLSGINADSEIASLFIATEQLAAEMQQFIAQFDKELALYEKRCRHQRDGAHFKQILFFRSHFDDIIVKSKSLLLMTKSILDDNEKNNKSSLGRVEVELLIASKQINELQSNILKLSAKRKKFKHDWEVAKSRFD